MSHATDDDRPAENSGSRRSRRRHRPTLLHFQLDGRTLMLVGILSVGALFGAVVPAAVEHWWERPIAGLFAIVGLTAVAISILTWMRSAD